MTAGIIVLGVLCLAGVFGAMHYAFTFGRQKPRPEPLPGGGGTYLLTVSGLETEADRRKLKQALSALQDVAAVQITDTQAAVSYAGLPGMDFADRLEDAVTEAGFSVEEIR